jgi:hypothetical protein
MLSAADGFIASKLRCHSLIEKRYTLFDYWRSHQHFEAFRRHRGSECESLSRWLLDEGVIEREVWLGSFYERDDDDGAELVAN